MKPSNNQIDPTLQCWAIVPAAGVGSRMKQDRPKQYLVLHGKTIIEYTIECLLSHSNIAAVVVAIADNDVYWPEIESKLRIKFNKPIITTSGGAQRADSVYNALTALQSHCKSNDWVLVHDAARPCLKNTDITKLINQVKNNAVGGLLAIPVRDTMKRSNSECLVHKTIDREGLWHALTPQMFRYAMLQDALHSAMNNGTLITDESSAMEYHGLQPLLVEGCADNIKVTRPEDLILADLYLKGN